MLADIPTQISVCRESYNLKEAVVIHFSRHELVHCSFSCLSLRRSSQFY